MTLHVNVVEMVEDELRYAWVFQPYRKNLQKFKIALHILPLRLVNKDFSYKQYPEIKIMIEQDISAICDIDTNTEFSGVYVYFDKSDTDIVIVNKLRRIADVLEQYGIVFSGVISAYRGFPSLTYGQQYLEHTTSSNNLTILDLVRELSSNDEYSIRKVEQMLPVTCAQKFDPDKDTEMEYAREYLEKEFKKVTERIKLLDQVSQAVDNIFTKVVVGNVEMDENETAVPTARHPFNGPSYSSEDSETYNDFQNNWI